MMRSLRYLLGGNPHNLEDCLHYSDRVLPEAVSVSLHGHGISVEGMDMTELFARFSWRFQGGKNTTYEHVCGTYQSCWPVKKQQQDIAYANFNLASLLARLEDFNISGKENRFETRK